MEVFGSSGSGGSLVNVRGDKSLLCSRADPRGARKVFYNELIMKNILETLAPEDLLTLRGTCTASSRIFTPKLKATHPPVLISGGRRGAPVAPRKTCKETLSRYANLMQFRSSQVSQDIPFTRYRVEEDENGHPKSADGSIQWRNPFEALQAPLGVSVGRSITYSQMCWHHTDFISVRDLRRLIFDQAPRLETIELRLCRSFGFGDPEQRAASGGPALPLPPRPALTLKRLKITNEFDKFGPAFGQLVYDTIVGGAGGLEYISIKIGNTEMSENLVSSTIVARFDLKVNLTKLKTLKISRVTSEELMALYQLANRDEVSSGNPLRLATLFMGIVVNKRSNLDERRYMTLMFNEFLASQAPTLRKLCLEFVGVEVTPFRKCSPELQMDFSVPFQVPRMERLHTFKITRTELMRVDLEFEGRTQERRLGGAFPGLRTLSYSHYEKDYGSDGDDTPSAGADENLTQDLRLLSHPTVTHLRVTGHCPNFTRFNSSLFLSVTWFQAALTSASADTTQETVAQIWTLFPELKKFYILIKYNFGRIGGDPLNLDQFLSGVNSPDAGKYLAALPAPPGRDELQKLGETYKTPGRPSISDQEHLEELTIFTEEGCTSNRTGLRDVGAWYGLGLAGPKFEKVEIYGPVVGYKVSDQYAWHFYKSDTGGML